MKKGVYLLVVLAIGLAVGALVLRPPVWDRPLALVLAAPVGLALGIVSLVWIKRGRLPGARIAWVAVVLCAFACLNTLVLDRMVEIKERPRDMRCLSNLKYLALATAQYCQDYDDRFPPAKRWNAALLPYLNRHDELSGSQPPTPAYLESPRRLGVSELLQCPMAEKTAPSYAMNAALASASADSVSDPKDTPLFFDSVPGFDRVGGRELLPSPPRHYYGQAMMCFADFSCSTVSSNGVARLWWRAVNPDAK